MSIGDGLIRRTEKIPREGETGQGAKDLATKENDGKWILGIAMGIRGVSGQTADLMRSDISSMISPAILFLA